LSNAVRALCTELNDDPSKMDKNGLRRWAFDVRMLGLTCDPAAIELVRPFLDVREPRDDHPISASALAPVSVRVCDCAYDAIRMLLGQEDKCILREVPPLGRHLRNFDAIHAARDATIKGTQGGTGKDGEVKAGDMFPKTRCGGPYLYSRPAG